MSPRFTTLTLTQLTGSLDGGGKYGYTTSTLKIQAFHGLHKAHNTAMDSIELANRHPGTTTPTSDASEPRPGERAATADDALNDNPERIEQQLAPVDVGIAAWRFLWAAFMFEACLWGKCGRAVRRAASN